MRIPPEVLITGGITVLGIVVLCIMFIVQRRQADFTTSESPDQPPKWIRTTPPEETVAATLADGEGVTLYDHDPGERLAAPFAEQIEDIVRAQLDKDPALAALSVDFGTSPGGKLEIWVDGVSYTDIELIPDTRLREVIQQAVERWEQG